MLEVCERLAVPVRGPRTRLGAEGLVRPPSAKDGTVPAPMRRLQALDAIDAIGARLQRAPRDPELHFLLGQIHLETLQNPRAAERHLCRAILEDPEQRAYRLTLRRAWMEPGEESHLEPSLAPRVRRLPWRRVLEIARDLRGLSPLEVAAAFEDSLTALRHYRAATFLPRERVRWVLPDAAQTIQSWVDEAPGKVAMQVVFPKGLANRVSALRRRAAPRTPERVWPGVGPDGRAMIHGVGAEAIIPILETAKRLGRAYLRIAVTCGERRLFLGGRLDGDRLRLGAFGAAPPAAVVRDAAGAP